LKGENFSPHSLRKVHKNELTLIEEIIFPAFVDYTHEAVLRGAGIR